MATVRPRLWPPVDVWEQHVGGTRSGRLPPAERGVSRVGPSDWSADHEGVMWRRLHRSFHVR